MTVFDPIRLVAIIKLVFEYPAIRISAHTILLRSCGSREIRGYKYPRLSASPAFPSSERSTSLSWGEHNQITWRVFPYIIRVSCFFAVSGDTKMKIFLVGPTVLVALFGVIACICAWKRRRKDRRDRTKYGATSTLIFLLYFPMISAA